LKAGLELSGCSVVDLSGIGGGCPDLLVGLNGKSVLVEIKVPSRKVQAGRLKSTKCGECKHGSKLHEVRGPCRKCPCEKFVLDIAVKEHSFGGGSLNARQQKFHRLWRGCPIVLVEKEEDLDRVLEELES